MDAAMARSWPPAFERAVRRESVRQVARARGRVLDLGFGLDHLDAYLGVGAVEEVVVLEPDARAAQRLERRAQQEGVPLVAVAPDARGRPPGDRPFDTVVSVVALPAFPDVHAVLGPVADRLVPGGRMLVLEPTRDHRMAPRVLSMPGQVLRPLAGLSLGREVPSAIRRCGLRITDMERLTMPTLLWPLRTVVRLTARRPDDALDAAATADALLGSEPEGDR
jgi:SAM-dependent methyltransferase